MHSEHFHGNLVFNTGLKGSTTTWKIVYQNTSLSEDAGLVCHFAHNKWSERQDWLPPRFSSSDISLALDTIVIKITLIEQLTSGKNKQLWSLHFIHHEY